MESYTNGHGDIVTSWASHKHPENPNFKQIVHWRVFERDGKTTVLYALSLTRFSLFYEVEGITKEEAIERFTDKETDSDPITEEEYQNWLDSRSV